MFTSIYDIENKNHSSNYFIGKVSYVRDDRLLSMLNKTYNISDLDDGVKFVKQLFIKRKPFKYEQEVRMIIRDENYEEDKKKISIDPNFLFEEITLDPWIKSPTFKKKEKEIRDAGYTGKIVRSSLYDKASNLLLKLK